MTREFSSSMWIFSGLQGGQSGGWGLCLERGGGGGGGFVGKRRASWRESYRIVVKQSAGREQEHSAAATRRVSRDETPCLSPIGTVTTIVAVHFVLSTGYGYPASTSNDLV